MWRKPNDTNDSLSDTLTETHNRRGRWHKNTHEALTIYIFIYWSGWRQIGVVVIGVRVRAAVAAGRRESLSCLCTYLIY